MENVLYVLLHDIRKSSSGMEIERSKNLAHDLGCGACLYYAIWHAWLGSQ